MIRDHVPVTFDLRQGSRKCALSLFLAHCESSKHFDVIYGRAFWELSLKAERRRYSSCTKGVILWRSAVPVSFAEVNRLNKIGYTAISWCLFIYLEVGCSIKNIQFHFPFKNKSFQECLCMLLVIVIRKKDRHLIWQVSLEPVAPAADLFLTSVFLKLNLSTLCIIIFH